MTNALMYGKVTQNNYWISYKTDSYCRTIKFLNELKDELEEFLSKKGIEHDSVFVIDIVYNSTKRLHCVTLMTGTVGYSYKKLPYEAEAIN